MYHLAKKIILLSILLQGFFLLPHAQQCKTVVPQKPVVSGESFSVQYIIEDADKISGFIPPSFPGFRLVSGPGVYNGTTGSLNQIHHVKNMVYTLEAMNPGRFLIDGATLQVDHSSFKSNSVFVQVISMEEGEIRKRTGDESAFVLLPGEDPYQKIKQNLFLKVDVDRQLCRVGEPVVATFKLYSRLQSKSDIVKNPGFYGFTVFDMINLADKISGSEKLNGKMYDVHILRKVQLYPLQAGTFQVDPMQLTNKVEFSKSSVNRKTEQQIIEGMFGNDDPGEKDPGTEVYETSLSSEPVTVTVKALPDKNKTKGFDAAVGKFSISSHLLKNEIHANEEGVLQVVVSGKGNFTQLNEPEIKWPEGIEVFDPVVKDSLDKMAVPLAGNRLFTYRFVAAKEGHYEIPAVQLSFFNTDTNRYVSIEADPEPLTVAGKIEQPVSQTKEGISSKTVTDILNSKKLLLTMIGLLIIATLVVFFLKKKATKKEIAETGAIINEDHKPFSAEEWFQLSAIALEKGDFLFYQALRQDLWHYFSKKLNLSGSEMNKQQLNLALQAKGITTADAKKVQGLLLQCETGVYTQADIDTDKAMMLKEAMELVTVVEKGC